MKDKITLLLLVIRLILRVTEFIDKNGGVVLVKEIEGAFDKWAAAKTKESQLEAAQNLAAQYSKPPARR